MNSLCRRGPRLFGGALAAPAIARGRMRWCEPGVVIAVRAHGETSAIATLFTDERGTGRGLVRGARSPRLRTVMQPGTRVIATWRGRLATHLGTFTCEPVGTVPATVLGASGRLATLQAACALIEAALPAGEPHRQTFARFGDLLDRLAADAAWAVAYLHWELVLLAELGFGLDLRRCAATGSEADLAYVSPRSGRAVGRTAGEPYRGRLLPLPACLTDPAAPAGVADLLAGLALTGHFLARALGGGGAARAPAAGLPEARRRLPARWLRQEPTARAAGDGAARARYE